MNNGNKKNKVTEYIWNMDGYQEVDENSRK